MFSFSSTKLNIQRGSLTLVILLLSSYNPALASAWDWGSNITLSSVYNDNPTLRDDDLETEDTFRFLAAYEMDMQRQSANRSFTFNPRVTRDYYPDSDKSDLESTDFFLNGSYRVSRPTFNWGLTANVDRQNILSNDNSVAQSGSANNTFRADDIQYTYRVSPSFSWQISGRDQMTISVSARKTDFDLDYTGRSDVEAYSFNTSYLRTLTLRQQVGISGSLSHSNAEGTSCRLDLNFITNPGNPQPPIFEPCTNLNDPTIVNAFNRNETDSYNLSIDYNYAWSETVSLKARYGLQSSDSSQIVRDADGVTLLIDADTFDENTNTADPIDEINSTFESSTYDIALTKQFETADYKISLNRQVIPSQAGTPQDRYQVGFDLNAKLTPRLDSRLKLTAWEQESIFLASDDNSTNINRKTRYFQGAMRLSWNFTRKLSMQGKYTYRYRDRDALGDTDSTTSTSNAINIGVSYKFKEMQR
jgi:hypothetical protein